MDASVVVCARNRARLLDVALQSLAAQTLDRGRFEVLVVDNASTDSTPEVAARWEAAAGFACRHVIEERLGTNHARNRGVREAKAPVVAFLDDDARAEPEWLDRLLAALREERASGVGGRIRLEWESPPPRWLTDAHLLALLAEFERGDVRCRIERFPFLVGTNMAFTADVFERVGGFGQDFERRGPLSARGMEDVEFCSRVARGGGTLVYEPGAVVHHFVPEHRARLSFLVRRSYADGRSMAHFQRLSGQRESGSRSRRLFRNLVALPVRALRGDWARSALAIVYMARHIGYMREARGLRQLSGNP